MTLVIETPGTHTYCFLHNSCNIVHTFPNHVPVLTCGNCPLNLYSLYNYSILIKRLTTSTHSLFLVILPDLSIATTKEEYKQTMYGLCAESQKRLT